MQDQEIIARLRLHVEAARLLGLERDETGTLKLMEEAADRLEALSSGRREAPPRSLD